MIRVLITTVLLLMVAGVTPTLAVDGYWVKTRFKTGPLPGAENEAEGSRSEQTFTMYISDRYLRIDQDYWDEYSEMEYGDGPSSMSIMIDFAESRRYVIDHDSQRVTFSDIEEGMDPGELIGNPFMSPFGDAEPGRSYAEAFEQMMVEFSKEDEEYITTELGQRTIIGFPAYGVHIQPVVEEDDDTPAEDGSAGGAMGIGLGSALDELFCGETWYEFWYSEDLGMPILIRMALFGGLLEIEVLEYEPWTPTAEEMRLPKDYELVYEMEE